MNTSKHQRQTAVFTLVAGILCCFAYAIDAESATVNVNWCANVPVQYTDSTSNEDYLPWANAEIPAQYMEFAVFHYTAGGWTEVARDYLTRQLGVEYCLPSSVSAVKGDLYRVRLYSKLKRNNRLVMIMSDASTWAAPNRYYDDWDITISPNYPTGSTQQINLYSMPAQKAYSAAGVVQRALSLGTDIDYPNSTNYEIYINQELTAAGVGDDCSYAFFSSPATNQMSSGGILRMGLCVPPVGGNAVSAIEKFQLAHEMGHAIAVLNNGPSNSNYDADRVGIFTNFWWSNFTVYCQCPVNSGGGRANHCIQSREYISSAQCESFATFIGTAIFNDRASGGYFNYYKDIYYDPPGTPGLATYPPPNLLNASDSIQWMRNKCRPFNTNVGGLGVEWDWLQFYWQLWAEGTSTQKITIAKINDVWTNTGFTTLCCSDADDCILPVNGNCSGGREKHDLGKMWSNPNNGSHPSGLDYLTTTTWEMQNAGTLTSTQNQRFSDLGNALGLDATL